jgi:hypothetical protein
MNVATLVAPARSRARNHQRRNVNADHPAFDADLLRDGERRRTAAASDVDDALASSDAGSRVEQLGNRREHLLWSVAALGPAAPARAIPIGGLIVVVDWSEVDLHLSLRLRPKA